MVTLSPDFYLNDPDAVARRLLGKILLRRFDDGGTAAGRICETEAYSPDDPASHSYGGRSERNREMFGAPGRAYVYLIYGLHHCLNAVTGPEGEGSAVLIRAMAPVTGLEEIRKRRGGVPDRNLCNGPGKLCRALGIDRGLDGHDLALPPLQILDDGFVLEDDQIHLTPRIGITKAADHLRRYVISPAGTQTLPSLGGISNSTSSDEASWRRIPGP